MPGELTSGSYADILVTLTASFGLSAGDLVVDAGSGRGLFLLAAAALTGAAVGGIECIALRCRLCLEVVRGGWVRLGDLLGCAALPPRTAFHIAHADLLHVASFGVGAQGAHYLYAFDIGMCFRVLCALAAAANNSPALVAVVSFQDLVAKHGLAAEEEVALRRSCSMHGSSEKHTAHFFRMLPAAQRGTRRRRRAAAPPPHSGHHFTLGANGRLVGLRGAHLTLWGY